MVEQDSVTPVQGTETRYRMVPVSGIWQESDLTENDLKELRKVVVGPHRLYEAVHKVVQQVDHLLR